jgi:hypothetical protein
MKRSRFSEEQIVRGVERGGGRSSRGSPAGSVSVMPRSTTDPYIQTNQASEIDHLKSG